MGQIDFLAKLQMDLADRLPREVSRTTWLEGPVENSPYLTVIEDINSLEGG